jgi:hypothetical protein
MSVSRIGCPASIRNLGGVVGHRHRDFEHDHLVGAGTRTTALVRSRLDCQINADNNRCRGTDPPLNTGRFIGLDHGAVHRAGSKAGPPPRRDHRRVRHAQPRRIRGSLTLTPTTPILTATPNRGANKPGPQLPDVLDGNLRCGRVRVSFNRAPPGHCCGSLAAWAGTQIARAPGWISANRVVDSPTTSPSSW